MVRNVAGGIVWLCFGLGVVASDVASLAQSQPPQSQPQEQPPAVRAPETPTPTDQQPAATQTPATAQPAAAQTPETSTPAAATPQTATPVDQPAQPSQSSVGRISGTVVDTTGAVVVGARVTLSQPNQPQTSEAPGGQPPSAESQGKEVLTGSDGQFTFTDVAPGAFTIRITAAGFAPMTSSGTLKAGEPYIAPPSTLVPAVKTEVEVAGSQVEIAEEQIKIQEQQRVLGVVPNFYVSYIPDAAPMIPRQKFHLAWRMTIDPVNLLLTGAVAGIQQADGRLKGYGQGAQGYAKRFGAAYADSVTSTFIGGAILPSLFRQDPRYFYKGHGGTGSRILYALSMAVVTKGDNQRWQPNYSNILGTLASGAISNLYYPKADRGVAPTFENAAVRIGANAVGNLVQEFIIRKLTPHAPDVDQQ
jgi:hypothetical protein